MGTCDEEILKLDLRVQRIDNALIWTNDNLRSEIEKIITQLCSLTTCIVYLIKYKVCSLNILGNSLKWLRQHVKCLQHTLTWLMGLPCVLFSKEFIWSSWSVREFQSRWLYRELLKRGRANSSFIMTFLSLSTLCHY